MDVNGHDSNDEMSRERQRQERERQKALIRTTQYGTFEVPKPTKYGTFDMGVDPELGPIYLDSEPEETLSDALKKKERQSKASDDLRREQELLDSEAEFSDSDPDFDVEEEDHETLELTEQDWVDAALGYYQQDAAKMMGDLSLAVSLDDATNFEVKRVMELTREAHEFDYEKADRSHPIALQPGLFYERQALGSNDCFAITAAAMYNQHLRKLGRYSEDAKLTHEDVRAYRPDFQTYDEYKTVAGVSPDAYIKEKRLIQSYTTPESHEMGNIYALSDMFLQLDSDVEMNYMMFDTVVQDDEQDVKKGKLKELFLDSIAKSLAGGEAVGLFFKDKSHYVTVTGLNGRTVEYMDSAVSATEVQRKSIDWIFTHAAGRIELTWLSEKRDPAEITAEYGNLHRNGDEYTSTASLMGENDAAHTFGVAGRKNETEKLRDGISRDILDYVSQMVYVPKKDVVEKLDIPTIRQLSNAYKLANHPEQAAQLRQKMGLKSAEAVHKDAGSTTAETSSKKVAQRSDGNDHEAEGSSTTKDIADSLMKQAMQGYVIPQFSEAQLSGNYTIPYAMSFLPHVNKFLADPTGDGSFEYRYLYEALNDNRQLLQDLDQNHRFVYTPSNYAQYVRLSQAVSAYVANHVFEEKDAKKQLYRAAVGLKYALEGVSGQIIHDKGLPEVTTAISYEPQEEEFAVKNVKRLITAYRTYCQRIDEDLVASDEEKLIRKWDALKSNERDILIYLKAQKKYSRYGFLTDEEDNYLEQEYTSLKQQIILHTMVKGDDQEESYFNQDEGLSKEQIAAVSRLDTWVIRNFRNGGIMGLVGVKADRTDIVSNLLSMSRRKRLYIYYLIETRERVEPTLDGFTKSQTDYIPDLDKFKGRMIASKFKFYKRFTGGYIYWHKLSEAMAIAGQADSMLEATQDVMAPNQETLAKQEDPGFQASLEGRRQTCAREMIVLAMEAMRLTRDNNDPATPPATVAANKTRMDAIKTRLGDLHQGLSLYLTDMIAESQEVEKHQRKDDVKLLASTQPSEVSKYASQIISVSRTVVADPLQAFQGIDINGVLGCIGGASTGLSVIGGFIGSLFKIYGIFKNRKSMTGLDITSESLSILRDIAKAGKGLTSMIALGVKNNHAIDAITGPIGSSVMAGVDTVVTIAKTCSYGRDGYHRKKACEIASRMENKDAFLEAMLELNELQSKKQRNGVISSATTTAVSATAAILIATGAVTFGVTSVAGVVTMGVGVVAKNIEMGDTRNKQMLLFDDFYNIYEEYEDALATYNQRNPRMPLTDEGKRKLLDHVRRRVAADKGFYSPAHGAKYAATKFAEELLRRAQLSGAEDNVYMELIMGLGLSYRHDPNNIDDDIPTPSDIAKKMCG